ncbi:MAG TPA: hypothetical protein VE619_11260 [Nitrososphaeraceae archaeon]|nr:hypothetical protein [Nitrososphaeraceae archaeon]
MISGESISLETSLGMNCSNKKVVTSMPLLVCDSDTTVHKNSLQSLHIALNMLAVNNKTMLGLVSESVASQKLE